MHCVEQFYLVGETPQPAALSFRYSLRQQRVELLTQPAAFCLSSLSAKHLETLAWPKDAISINQLEEIGMVPPAPALFFK